LIKLKTVWLSIIEQGEYHFSTTYPSGYLYRGNPHMIFLVDFQSNYITFWGHLLYECLYILLCFFRLDQWSPQLKKLKISGFVGIRNTLSTSTGPIWLESDCLATVRHSIAIFQIDPLVASSLSRQKKMLRLFQDFKVKGHRSANGVAHALGKFSRSIFLLVFYWHNTKNST